MKPIKGKGARAAANATGVADSLVELASHAAARVARQPEEHGAPLEAFKIVRRPKGLRSGLALLAFLDEQSITVQIVSPDDRSALKAQFRHAAPGISAQEEDVLRHGGASASELKLGPTLLAAIRHRSHEQYRSLFRSSLGVTQAARRLGLSDSRIRQLLLAQHLYGFKRGTDWRIPSFQFQGRELVPGIDAVVPKIRSGLPPIAVYNWFTTPHPDLRTEAEEEEGFTPIDWLRSGHAPEAASSLAAEL